MTYESLAEHTGKSRSGLLYHFPSKEHMVDAARDYAAGQWNAAAERHLPGRFEDASPAERAYAYIVATVEEQQATDGGYFQSVVHAEFAELVWNDVRQRWIDYGEGGLGHSVHLAVLAADGLWSDHGVYRMLPDVPRGQVIAELKEISRPTPNSGRDPRSS